MRASAPCWTTRRGAAAARGIGVAHSTQSSLLRERHPGLPGLPGPLRLRPRLRLRAAPKPEPDWRTFRGAAQRRSPSARRVVRRNPEKETSFCSCSLGLHGIFCFARVFLQDLLACEGGIPSSRRKLRVFGIRLGGCGVSDPRAVSDRARLSFGCRGSGPVCKKHCQA